MPFIIIPYSIVSHVYIQEFQTTRYRMISQRNQKFEGVCGIRMRDIKMTTDNTNGIATYWYNKILAIGITTY